MEALVAGADDAGLWTIQTSIFPENAASIALHERLGFREVGRRERIARLHGVWRDTLLLERRSQGSALTGFQTSDSCKTGGDAAPSLGATSPKEAGHGKTERARRRRQRDRPRCGELGGSRQQRSRRLGERWLRVQRHRCGQLSS